MPLAPIGQVLSAYSTNTCHARPASRLRHDGRRRGAIRAQHRSTVGTDHTARRRWQGRCAGCREALGDAEVTMQTVVAVRDKILGAYNDIMKMSI